MSADAPNDIDPVAVPRIDLTDAQREKFLAEAGRLLAEGERVYSALPRAFAEADLDPFLMVQIMGAGIAKYGSRSRISDWLAAILSPEAVAVLVAAEDDMRLADGFAQAAALVATRAR